ncbi:hypothetical protein BDV06DRAFT_198726 [Aspergillus oleicola]
MTPPPIKKVALAGKGRLGTVVLSSLLENNYTVKILTRSTASHPNLPPGVELQEVDYTSLSSLKHALTGIEAVVSTVSGTAIASQKPLIDAAIAVGVKHFIPADYAMSTRSSPLNGNGRGSVRDLPPYTDVREIERYLISKTSNTGTSMDFTIVATGGFLEYIFDLPFVLSIPKRKADIVNGGAVPFSISDFETVGRAIVGVLNHPERVEGHCVQVHGGLITQNECLRIVKTYDEGPGEWAVKDISAAEKFNQGLDMLQRGEFTMEAVSTLMAGVVWDRDYGCGFEETDNDWLGVDLISREKINEMIRDRVTHGVKGIASDTIVSNV